MQHSPLNAWESTPASTPGGAHYLMSSSWDEGGESHMTEAQRCALYS